VCKWGTLKKVKLCKPSGLSKRIEINVDACIADLIQALNNANIETVASCCGHGKGLGIVSLKDGRELHISPDFKSARKLEKLYYEKNIK
jgi:ribosomal protein L32E